MELRHTTRGWTGITNYDDGILVEFTGLVCFFNIVLIVNDAGWSLNVAMLRSYRRNLDNRAT